MSPEVLVEAPQATSIVIYIQLRGQMVRSTSFSNRSAGGTT